MTERGDAPAGSGSPEGGVKPSSASEILRRLREKNANSETAATPSVDLDFTSLGPPDLSPPDLTRPPLSSSIMSAEQRRAENDRLAEAARASRSPSEPATPDTTGRSGFRRVFGGLFGTTGNAGGGGGGNNEPPRGPDFFGEEPEEPKAPGLRSERIIPPDAKPWEAHASSESERKERKSKTIRAIIEEVDIVPRSRDYGRIKEAYEAMKKFFWEETEYTPEQQQDHKSNVIKKLIKQQKQEIDGKVEEWQQPYAIKKQLVEKALDALSKARELAEKGEMSNEDLMSYEQSFATLNSDLALFMNETVQPRLQDARTKQLEYGIRYIGQDAVNTIKDQLDNEGLVGDQRTAREQQLLIAAIEAKIGGKTIVAENPREAITGVEDKEPPLWSDLYGTLQITGESKVKIQEALTSYWKYIDSPDQIPDPQRVIGDLQRIRQLVVRANIEKGMEKEDAEAIADNSDFWLSAVLNNRFSRVGDKGNRAALLGYAAKERFRPRLRSLFSTEGIGGYDPAKLAIGLHLLGERGYSTLIVRPEGPRFEMMKETHMHGWFREAVQDAFTEELALYDLRVTEGANPIDQEIEEAEARSMMGWAMSKDDFEKMYVRRKKEDFTPEEWDKRLTEAKHVSRLSQLFNSFMGNQAEMHVSRIEAENGDAVLRRHAEYFVKYAVISEMAYRGDSPIQVEKKLIGVSSSARTPQLKGSEWYKDTIDKAIKEIEKNGNNATLTYKWKDENGKELTITEKIEDIIEKDEVRIAWDGYIANDGPLRAAYLSEKTTALVRDNMKVRPDKRKNFGTENYIAMLRKLMDPKLELPSIGYVEEEQRYCAEALDFVGRLQTEVSQAVFLNFFENMYLGSNGLGPFADSHVYGMRDGLRNARTENVKYMEKMIALLPEIFAIPTSFGCLKISELPHLVLMQDPNKLAKLPEVFEDWSGELRGDEYQVQTALREFCLNGFDKEGKMRKGFFYEPLNNRDGIEDTLSHKVSMIHDIEKGNQIKDDKADVLVNGAMSHLSSLAALTSLTVKLYTDTRKMSSVGTGNWAAGLIYDYWMDRMSQHGDHSEHGYHNSPRDQDPQSAYGTRIGHEIYLLFGAKNVESSNRGVFKDLRDLIKEKMITTMGKFAPPAKSTTQH
jgi:hypothetical protein